MNASNASVETDALIQPRKGRGDPDLGPDALLVVTPQDLARMSKTRPMDRFDLGFFRVFRIREKAGRLFALAGPVLGAPQAVMVLEKLIALGASRIFLFGWCGSIHPDLRIGDMIIPLQALSQEGTSGHYPIGNRAPETDQELNRVLENALDRVGLPFQKGTVWTTDAPYRETASKVMSFREKGALAVEMEMSALMTVAIYRGVKLSGLLVVSDELHALKWRPGFSNPLFKKRCEQAGDLLTALVQNQG